MTSAPYVTWTLLGIMVAGFLAQQLNPHITSAFGMFGGGGGGFGAGVAAGEWYRLLTAAFVHGGLMHLLFNGFALYILGPQLERWLGHARYLALWVLSAIGGSVLTYVAAPLQLTVGASGAIFGLFGAVFVIGRKLGLDTRFILGLLAINLLITFTVPNISWTGHIGGLVSGALLALVYAYLPAGNARGERRDRRRAIVHSALTLGFAVILVVITVLWTVMTLGS